MSTRPERALQKTPRQARQREHDRRVANGPSAASEDGLGGEHESKESSGSVTYECSMATDLTAWRGSLQPESERSALEERLAFCRRAAIARIEDLDDAAAAAQPLPTTDLTAGGVVKHLARTEDGWFARTFAGQPMPAPWSVSPAQTQSSWAFESSRSDTVADIIALYEASITRSEEIAARCESLNQIAAQVSFGKAPVTLRWLLVHMITETAWHLGHLDLLRDALGAPHVPD